MGIAHANFQRAIGQRGIGVDTRRLIFTHGHYRGVVHEGEGGRHFPLLPEFFDVIGRTGEEKIALLRKLITRQDLAGAAILDDHRVAALFFIPGDNLIDRDTQSGTRVQMQLSGKGERATERRQGDNDPLYYFHIPFSLRIDSVN